MLAVVLYPFLYNIAISFSNMSLGHLRDVSFIGLDHFRTIFTEPEILRVFLKTVVWTGVNVTAHLTFGIGLRARYPVMFRQTAANLSVPLLSAYSRAVGSSNEMLTSATLLVHCP